MMNYCVKSVLLKAKIALTSKKSESGCLNVRHGRPQNGRHVLISRCYLQPNACFLIRHRLEMEAPWGHAIPKCLLSLDAAKGNLAGQRSMITCPDCYGKMSAIPTPGDSDQE